MNVTDLMLDYIIKKSNNDISDEVYLKSKYCLIDYLGVTYAGAKENIDTIEKVCGQKERPVTLTFVARMYPQIC